MKLFIQLLAITSVVQLSAQIQPKVQEKAYTHKNLTIFLLESEEKAGGSYMTLEDAMKQDKIVLHETGSVNELSIDNKSDSYVFLMAGDIVKGGKQDRTIGEDVVLKPAISGNSNVVGFVFCINGKISTVEWFDNAALYNKLSAKLFESAANEAVSNYDRNAKPVAIRAQAITDFISEAKSGNPKTEKSATKMLEKQYKTAKSVMFESYNTTISETVPVHVSIYSTDGVSISEPVVSRPLVSTQLPINQRIRGRADNNINIR